LKDIFSKILQIVVFTLPLINITNTYQCIVRKCQVKDVCHGGSDFYRISKSRYRIDNEWNEIILKVITYGTVFCFIMINQLA